MCRWDRTNRPTIDSRCLDTGEKSAIETRISGNHRAVTDGWIEVGTWHDLRFRAWVVQCMQPRMFESGRFRTSMKNEYGPCANLAFDYWREKAAIAMTQGVVRNRSIASSFCSESLWSFSQFAVRNLDAFATVSSRCWSRSFLLVDPVWVYLTGVAQHGGGLNQITELSHLWISGFAG